MGLPTDRCRATLFLLLSLCCAFAQATCETWSSIGAVYDQLQTQGTPASPESIGNLIFEHDLGAERSRFEKTLVDAFPGTPKKSIKILDLGCGGGDHVCKFNAAGFAADGIDASEEMLTWARFSNQHYTSTLLRGDFRSFPPNHYHGLWAVKSLMHTHKAEMPALMRQLINSLIQGGSLFFTLAVGQEEGAQALGFLYNEYSVDELRAIFAEIPDAEVIVGEEIQKRHEPKQIHFLVRKK